MKRKQQRISLYQQGLMKLRVYLLSFLLILIYFLLKAFFCCYLQCTNIPEKTKDCLRLVIIPAIEIKNYCMQALEHASNPGIPKLAPNEQADFQRAQETVTIYARLVQSLQRQNRARLIIRTWRYVHIVLACLALLIILYHGILELLTNVLHVIG